MPDNQFFSLGFHPQGHLTLALEQPVATGLITIWETTWRNGNYCLETAAHLPSGIYLARLQVGNRLECRKMTLLK